MSHHLTDEMRSCIEDCRRCETLCLSELGHCLHAGGAHTEPGHFMLMLDCIEICGTAAEFMARASGNHPAVCRICAEICRACAASCEQVGDMDECVEACRQCAVSCALMAA